MSVYQSKSGRLYLKREDELMLILLKCLVLNPTTKEVLKPHNWKTTIVLEKIYEIK